jgi:hypothetical protein
MTKPWDIPKETANIPTEPNQENTADIERKKQEVVSLFKKILNRIVLRGHFHLLELGLKNANKGYGYSMEGRTQGFKEMDPFCLRGKVLELTSVPKALIENFDDLMCNLSATDSVPWKNLRNTFDEAVIERDSKK